ncbi:30S ribosomal protein S9 [Thermoplasmatales archaeon SW_10_69_26]|jgi:small subunit ribosomal protein S9|nr:MAG: 30S ribosomal protein S9 [Thermoplasmatales archaeon SW_10_69_26]
MADDVVNTSGKRKEAVARATVRPGEGRIRINNRPVEIMEPRVARDKMLEPLRVAGVDHRDDVDINVSVEGGGFMGQADAARTAIARGLVDFFDDPELQQTFLRYDRSLLVNDPRRKEPKQPMGPGARAKRQKSYR